MFSPQRYSFRQLLLVAFLLIAALLSVASLRGLYLLEGLLRQSSEGARQAVARTADAQVLAERTVAMERAARQFLVLEDPLLRQHFDETAHDAARRAGAAGRYGYPVESGTGLARERSDHREPAARAGSAAARQRVGDHRRLSRTGRHQRRDCRAGTPGH